MPQLFSSSRERGMVGLHFERLQRDLRQRDHPEDEDVQQPLARQRGSGVRGEFH